MINAMDTREDDTACGCLIAIIFVVLYACFAAYASLRF